MSDVFTEYPEVLDLKQLCEILNVSLKTGYGLIQDNKIKCLKIGRAYRIPDYITNRHKALLKKAGLPHVRFHDLRHSCVGLMMANEVPMERIRDWVGHSDIRTTVNTYGHLEYHSKKKTAEIIGNSLTGRLSTQKNTVASLSNLSG